MGKIKDSNNKRSSQNNFTEVAIGWKPDKKNEQ